MLICQRNGGTTISSKVATGEQRAPHVHIALGLTSPRRFIPLQDWPRLILSLFALHNETRTSAHSLRASCLISNISSVNIHTHLIPFLLWSFAWFRFSPSYDTSNPYQHEPAQVTFGVFALLCLFTSALWHTMAGCAHPKGMELCARVDYVGIGWWVLLF